MFPQQERGQVPLLHSPLWKGWKEGSASLLPQLQGGGGVGALHGAGQSRPASRVTMTTVRAGQVGLPRSPWQHQAPGSTVPRVGGQAGGERRAGCSCTPAFSPLPRSQIHAHTMQTGREVPHSQTGRSCGFLNVCLRSQDERGPREKESGILGNLVALRC